MKEKILYTQISSPLRLYTAVKNLALEPKNDVTLEKTMCLM